MQSMQSVQSIYESDDLLYNILPNGIHEFVIKKPTADALEGIFNQLEKLYAEIPQSTTVLELIDSRGGSIPISKAMRLTRSFVAKIRDWPNVRVAVLYQDNLSFTVVQPIVQLL